MRIVGIDPGTKCGWAVVDDGRVIASGVWTLKSKRDEGAGMRYLRVRSYLSELLDKIEPDALAYEEVRRHAGTTAAHVYGGIVSQVTSLCEAAGLPYRSVPVADAKTRATGNGRASKSAMLKAARAIAPDQAVLDDNQADAIFIALCLHDELAGSR